MNNKEIEKAEYKQALHAYLIPTTLFLACLLGAAGIFLIREGYGLGWGFIAASVGIIVWAMTAFVTFQNKLRARGLMKDQYDRPAPGLEADDVTSLSQQDLPGEEFDASPESGVEVEINSTSQQLTLK